MVMKSIRKIQKQMGYSDWRIWPFYGLFSGIILFYAVPLLPLIFILLALVWYLAIQKDMVIEYKQDRYVPYDQEVKEWHKMLKPAKPMAEWRPVVFYHRIRRAITNRRKYFLPFCSGKTAPKPAGRCPLVT